MQTRLHESKMSKTVASIGKLSASAIASSVKSAFERLGNDSVREEQFDSVRAILEGRDAFVSLPTGSGKSLCYGCLPLVFDELQAVPQGRSIVVVVSPLMALMMDQVQTFSTKGVKAAYLGVDDIEGSTGDQVEKGEISLVFMSPELMITGCRWREMFRSAVYQENLGAVVVDEAHCVDKW